MQLAKSPWWNSSKFWIGILTFLVNVVGKHWGVEIPFEANAGLLGYIAAEGLADAAHARSDVHGPGLG
jgi:hypothetical protein